MKTLIVHIGDRSTNRLSPHEFSELAESAGVDIVFTYFLKIKSVNAKYYIGPGQLSSLKEVCHQLCVEQVILSIPLKASHQKHWVCQLKIPTIDIHELVMDIFAKRAITYEGKLQVELAQCRYLSTRLKGGWTHLERQKGGIGLRGPGETQLETDRRLLQNRIRAIEARLKKVVKTRHENRKRRLSHHGQIVGIVGCTNAGKSTLFNQLTNAGIYAADKMFATLDPTVRRMRYQGLNDCLIIDTVGFMQDFPAELISAFSATLSELESTDLILHIIDASDPNMSEKIDCIEGVLHGLKISAPVKRVYNKVDLVSNYNILADNVIGITATSARGIAPLLQYLKTTFTRLDPEMYVKNNDFVSIGESKVQ